MTDCNCGCSTFGGEPHDADLRHPNPKACRHAEVERTTPIEELLDPEALRADLDSIVDPSL